eukprot:9865637-Alexandrium_andersonii.AAC.1
MGHLHVLRRECGPCLVALQFLGREHPLGIFCTYPTGATRWRGLGGWAPIWPIPSGGQLGGLGSGSPR